ncbi:hypothetical protein [Inquilinus sp. CAU 1745]|uniref:hypothetical protein n=1 Tax=Inquilinus sp. CAU 1745 TaxID=3140369 RepID=UPI00325A86AB
MIHTTEETRNAHPAYVYGKAGAPEAATTLVADLIDESALERTRAIADGFNPILVPASAFEKYGFNAIPDALAHELADRLDLEFDPGEI